MFVLLKLLLHLFRPLIWIVLLFLYALLTKNAKRKRLSFRVGFGVLLFFTNPLLSNLCLKAYEAEPVQLAPTQTYNVGIVLGGLVSYSPDDDAGYFNNVSDRFIQTALLYKGGHIRNIVVAAGNGYPTKNRFTEAGFIKAHLVQLGIPAEKIFTDGESRNTLENAQNTRLVLDSAHLRGPYLLISSAMHLPRAVQVFRKAGVDAAIYPCDFLSRGTGNNLLEDYLLPSSLALPRWDNLIKEIVGRTVYLLTGKT